MISKVDPLEMKDMPCTTSVDRSRSGEEGKEYKSNHFRNPADNPFLLACFKYCDLSFSATNDHPNLDQFRLSREHRSRSG